MPKFFTGSYFFVKSYCDIRLIRIMILVDLALELIHSDQMPMYRQLKEWLGTRVGIYNPTRVPRIQCGNRMCSSM